MINRGRFRYDKKRIQPRKTYVCKFCGGNDHYAFACFNKPKKPLKQESDKTRTKRRNTRKKWFKINPPDEAGHWQCYLRIAEKCLVFVDVNTINLEHVRSKARAKSLEFVVENIKAACEPCNKLKASWSVTELAETYPHLFAMITTPEWQEYEKLLDSLESSAHESL